MWSSSSESDDELENNCVYKNRINFQFNNGFKFNERFRLGPVEVEELLVDIGYRLEHPTNKSKAMSVKHQLLTTLHWLGNGCQYHGIADMHGISKSSVCRLIHSVIAAINEIKFQKIVCLPFLSKLRFLHLQNTIEHADNLTIATIRLLRIK